MHKGSRPAATRHRGRIGTLSGIEERFFAIGTAQVPHPLVQKIVPVRG